MRDGGRAIWIFGIGASIFSGLLLFSECLFFYLNPLLREKLLGESGGILIIVVIPILLLLISLSVLRIGQLMQRGRAMRIGGILLIFTSIIGLSLGILILLNLYGPGRTGSPRNLFGGSNGLTYD